ncbi:MAG: universal stress protein [Alphaproteobacteria bacterium]|nr:universal stress protein [Alphaproteobacteria bacterium]
MVTHAHAAEAVAAFARAEQIENPDAIELAKCAANNLAPIAAEARTKGVRAIDTTVLRGDAAAELLNYAKSSGADLIVLGRRGLGGVASVVLGSVSAKIAGHGECAVLTVK